MSIWDGLEQLAQQPDPERIELEKRPVGILGLLATAADKLEHPSLLGLSSESEPEQPQGLLGQLLKGD